MNVKNIFLDIIRLNSDQIKGSYIFEKMQKRVKEEFEVSAPDNKTQKVVVMVNKNGENKALEIDLDENENL